MSNTYRVLDVMIAGAQKAGTTSLAAYLEQHPSITSHRQTEITFFIREDEYKKGYKEIYDNYFSTVHDDSRVLMGKSAGVMYVEQAIQRLHQHNPNCKVITILRNPVSRAHSAYWYMRSVGYETARSFEEALALERSRQGDNDLRASLLAYRNRGIYYCQIQNLYEYFGRENVHVLLLDKLISSPEESIKNILEFLSVDSSFKINTEKKENEGKMAYSETLSRVIVSDNKLKRYVKQLVPADYRQSVGDFLRQINKRSFDKPIMDPQTKRELIRFFQPYNQELENMIGVSVSHWNY